jgi:hypothetical protein
LLVTRVPREQRSEFPAIAGKLSCGPLFNVDVIAFFAISLPPEATHQFID